MPERVLGTGTAAVYWVSGIPRRAGDHSPCTIQAANFDPAVEAPFEDSFGDQLSTGDSWHRQLMTRSNRRHIRIEFLRFVTLDNKRR
jgi:hypothetical protein